MIAYTITYVVLSLASIPCMGRYFNGTWWPRKDQP